MKLELATHHIDEVELGSATRIQNGRLEVNPDDLRRVALGSDPYLADMDVHVARPGESVRLINVVDIVEPRSRQDGGDFPGLLSAPREVGHGRTIRLAGVAVTETAPPVQGEPTYWREAVIDMQHPGALYSPFSEIIHVVVSFTPNHDLFNELDSNASVFEGSRQAIEFNLAVRKAGLRIAVYLADIAGGPTTDVESFELTPADSSLPRVVYYFQSHPYVYGDLLPSGGVLGGVPQLPTTVHPNEVFDGALVNVSTGIAGARDVTWLIQNHALIMELYQRHNHDLALSGVVLYTNGDNSDSKERITTRAATFASMINAQGAILNHLGGGHSAVDVMMLCRKLEQRGIKTTLMLMEMASGSGESGFVDFVPEADAIVSTGNYEEPVLLAPVKTVLGGAQLIGHDTSPFDALKLPAREILGSTNYFGQSSLTAETW